MERTPGIVNVFSTPYEKWSQRQTTIDEAMVLVNSKGYSIPEALNVNDKRIAVISTHAEAASYILRQSDDNGLERHIDRALDRSAEYHALRKFMPKNEPEAIRTYQGRFSEYDYLEADSAIKAYGMTMAEGQILFHGGLWTSKNAVFITSRPFSTSFCPQVALRNAEWMGKAYDVGRVDLMLVRVRQPKTPAYACSRNGDHGNEKEVVFASGAQLTYVAETLVTDCFVSKTLTDHTVGQKRVPGYVLEVEIS